MQRTTCYFDESFINKMDGFIKENNLKSRNELLQKAVDFYIDYNNNKEPGTFLSKEIEAIMSGNVELAEKRLGNRFAKLMSETAIQLGIMQQILKSISDINGDDIENFRKVAVDEIRDNQKILKYEDL